MWHYYTAPDKRDAMLTIAVLAVLVIFLLGGVVPFLAAWAGTGTMPTLRSVWTFWTASL